MIGSTERTLRRANDPNSIKHAAEALLSDLGRSSKMHLGVAFSGGLDSTVLLHALSEVRNTSEVLVTALHVNHQIHPDAARWASHCVAYANSLGVECSVLKVDLDNRMRDGLEAAARRARHKVLIAADVDTVAMAHHLSDQAETLLFNLGRGCGILGASGIPKVRSKIVRPFLNIPRLCLVKYANENRLDWIDDPSNTDRRFTRNFLRHEVFPRLRERLPAFEANLMRAAEHAADADQMLYELAVNDLGRREAPMFPIDTNLLSQLSPSRTKNAIRVALRIEGLQPPAAKRMDEFVRQLKSARSDRQPELRTKVWTLKVAGKRMNLISTTPFAELPQCDRVKLEDSPQHLEQ